MANYERTLFPPLFSKDRQSSEQEDTLGAKIADAYYTQMKDKVKDDFLRLSHIAKITKITPHIQELYKEITKDNLKVVQEEYVKRILDKKYASDKETTLNLELQFMSGYFCATAKA